MKEKSWYDIDLRMSQEKQISLCIYTNKKFRNFLLTSIFTQISPNLEEFVCTPRSFLTLNLSLNDIFFKLRKDKKVYRQNDRKTARQN